MNVIERPAPPDALEGSKEVHELEYWTGRKQAEGVLANGHYEHFYTHHFGLEKAFYRDSVLLDVGCGPRGSLEWATNAARRYGVDPLANDYLMLGAIDHEMRYLCAPSERIPVPDGHCDAVFSFNSLDHVEDVDLTLQEIKRITKPGGLFLLLVEVNHEPTPCEPHMLTPDGLLASLRPEFDGLGVQVFASVPQLGMYESIRAGRTLPSPAFTREAGYLSAMFLRR